MQRTAIITITADDDTQQVTGLDVKYDFQPPLTADHSMLASVVGYLLKALNKVAVSGQLQLVLALLCPIGNAIWER